MTFKIFILTRILPLRISDISVRNTINKYMIKRNSTCVAIIRLPTGYVKSITSVLILYTFSSVTFYLSFLQCLHHFNEVKHNIHVCDNSRFYFIGSVTLYYVNSSLVQSLKSRSVNLVLSRIICLRNSLASFFSW